MVEGPKDKHAAKREDTVSYVAEDDVQQSELLRAKLSNLIDQENVHREQQVQHHHVSFLIKFVLCELSIRSGSRYSIRYSISAVHCVRKMNTGTYLSQPE